MYVPKISIVMCGGACQDSRTSLPCSQNLQIVGKKLYPIAQEVQAIADQALFRPLNPLASANYIEACLNNMHRQIRVPGFSDANIKPYRRPAAKILHESRTAAIRQATSAASDAAATAAEKEKVGTHT